MNNCNKKCGDCTYFDCCEYYDWDTYDKYIKHQCSKHPEMSVCIDNKSCEDFKEER